MYLIGKREKFNGNVFFQTLEGHSVDSIKILRKYIEINGNVIHQFCERWKINEKLFLKNLFIFVYLHDIGKATKQFQENISRGKHSQKYPHSYYSLFLLRNLEYDKLINEVPIEKLAILGHHTQLYRDIYDDSHHVKPNFVEKEIILDFLNNIKLYHEELGFNDFFDLNDLNISIDLEFKSNNFFVLLNNLKRQSYNFKKKIKLKSIFSFFFSILQLCDDYSSANFSDFVKNYNVNKKYFSSVLENPEKYVYNLDNNSIDNIFSDIEPYKFQKNIMEKYEEFSLLFAPCGRGKTEASLGWAMKVMENYHKNKIIFAMPTQVTSNAMYERLCKLFGEKNIGLFHGNSFIKLKSFKKSDNKKINEDEEIDFNEIKDETFKGNIFFKPITVTTIDHVIYSFVHGFSQADFALGNIQNSIIIFDEIHIYEDITLNYLFALFKMLKSMKIPHLLMTGTLPQFIENNLSKYCKFTDDEGLKFAPFSFKLIKGENLIRLTDNYVNSNVINEIYENYHKNLKQFIILNTIDRAKEFYKALKVKFDNENIILYHSQFTHCDRIIKEDLILEKSNKKNATKGFILIATQIIEISLDISCDIMYTEIAPPDAIGQRGGRLNRKGKSNIGKINHEMKLFLPESNLPYNNDNSNEYMDSILSLINNNPVDYNYIKKMCDDFYNNRCIEKTNLNTLFRECSLFGHSPKDMVFNDEDEGKLLKLRSNNFQKIDVIPLSAFQDNEDNLIPENLAKIPLWWFINSQYSDEGNPDLFDKYYKNGTKPYIICNMKYNSEYGFDNSSLDDEYYNSSIGK